MESIESVVFHLLGFYHLVRFDEISVLTYARKGKIFQRQQIATTLQQFCFADPDYPSLCGAALRRHLQRTRCGAVGTSYWLIVRE